MFLHIVDYCKSPKMIILILILMQMFLCSLCHGYTASRKGRIWDTVDKLASELPNVVDLLNGRTSIGKMSWADINSLVKHVIGEVDHISEDLGEVKDEFQDHAMGFVGATVTLSLFSALALLLLCLLAMKMKKKFGRPRSGTLPTSNLERIRRNLQEFAKIRKMSVGETTAPLHNASNYHNPGYNPYFNPNLPMANGTSNYAPQQGSQASVPQPTNNTPQGKEGDKEVEFLLPPWIQKLEKLKLLYYQHV